MRAILCFILLAITSSALAESTLIYEAKRKEIELIDKDKEILEIGEISTPRYVTGGILGTYPIGFGVGHAIQGRWDQRGWIFTAGEFGSLAIAVSGLVGCMDKTFESNKCSDLESTLIVTGLVGFVGFRIWEIVDVWAAPPSHNTRYRELKEYIEKTPEKKVKASLDLVPVISPRLGQGLALNFRF